MIVHFEVMIFLIGQHLVLVVSRKVFEKFEPYYLYILVTIYSKQRAFFIMES